MSCAATKSCLAQVFWSKIRLKIEKSQTIKICSTDLSKDKITLGHIPHIGLIGSKPAQIIQNSMATTAISTYLNEPRFAAKFRRGCHVNGVWQAGLKVLPEKVVKLHVQDNHQGEDID